MDGASLARRMASADELLQQFTEELDRLESYLTLPDLGLERSQPPPSNQTDRHVSLMQYSVINPGGPVDPSFGGMSPVLPEVPRYQVTPNHPVRPTSVPLGRLNPQPSLQVNNPSTMSESQKALFKARDIELLRLKDLCGIDANSGKRFFFKQIRQLGGNEVDQVQLALSRMDRDLRLFVGTRLDNDPIQTLAKVESILDEEFSGPQSLADSMRELYALRYDLEQNPRQFAHEFKIKFVT